jgi:NADH:quinone reductase (non-electrogenic)
MNLAPALTADRREPLRDGRVPRVVIVGAGFGGIEAAKALARSPVEVVVVDEKNHHCFQPLLYQVATAALSPADIAWPIRSMLRRQDNARVMLARVIAVNQAERIVRTDFGPVPYDYLVLATGATHFYFGHDEWGKFAPGLKHIEDARRIRRRILISVASIRWPPASCCWRRDRVCCLRFRNTWRAMPNPPWSGWAWRC